MNKKLVVVSIVAWAIAVVACVTGAVRVFEAHAAARDAATNVGRLDLLKIAIVSLRTMEDRAQLQEKSQGDSNKVLIAFARNAAIRESQITEIDRLPLQKLGESNYQRDDVIIRVMDVKASSLVAFLASCSAPSAGYAPVSVQLRAQPQSEQATIDLWTAELVLTRVLFAAKNPTSDLSHGTE